MASDLCGEAAVIVEESYDYACATSYVLTRTFTAIDLCGNTTVGTQTITVTDTTAPEFTSIPADYTAECSDELDQSLPTATDNCDEVIISVEEEIIAGDCANEYTLIRTFTASDDCGNASRPPRPSRSRTPPHLNSLQCLRTRPSSLAWR